MFAVLCIGLSTIFVPKFTAAQESGGLPAKMLVTVEAQHGSDVPVVSQPDVIVFEGHKRDQVTSWVPAQGDNGALELLILLDDSSSFSLGAQLDELRRFINSQATSTKVGVAYMDNGSAKIQQNLTADHELAARALRLPQSIAGINGSPYFSLSDLIKRWPDTAARREVLMVTDGIDRYYGQANLEDPYLDSAIDDAQRAGVIVYAIYTPGAGHFAHSYWQSYWGQLYLSKLADETGGEGYYIGFQGPPVTFNPYLEDLGRRLGRQYWLEFVPQPQKKSGFQALKLRTEVHNAELVAAHNVYVQGAPR